MKQIKYLREPGYMYDLIFIYFYYFNQNYCLDNFVNRNKTESDFNFYNGTMYEFSDIPDDLFLFFNIKDNGRCFFATHYFAAYKSCLVYEYNLTFIQRLLLNYDDVIKNMMTYYFCDADENKITLCLNSVQETAKLIKASDYSDKIKNGLYDFFINPIPLIEKLNQSLISAGSLLSKYYERNIQTIVNTQNQIKIEELTEKLNKGKKHNFSLDSFEEIYVSICLLNKICVYTFFSENDALILFGYDYEDYYKFLESQQNLISLDEVANVLSEKNRIKILDLILEKGEVSVRDLESELNISGTNAYYHITMMLKINIIKSRNEGKTVLYSINKNQFKAVANTINKYYI